MKVTRLAVLAVALAAGGLAALMATRMRSPAPPPVVVERTEAVPLTDVLVAARDLVSGNVLAGSAELSWQRWPKEAVSAQFITREARPNAMDELKGGIVRIPFAAGEPIKEQKLVLGAKGGFMSAILTAGMRAVSTEISPETGAGGFILPHDKVDVILTRRDAGAGGRQGFQSETILRNIRVLAIDQTVSEKNGEKVVVGRTATLELTPRQAETLALARQLGTLQLALRSLTEQDLADSDTPQGRAVSLVRFGIVSQTR